MKLITYLSFDGRCREAFEFYARALGGKIVAMVSHGETAAAEHVPAEWQDKIINAHHGGRRRRADGRRRTAAICRADGRLLGLAPARRGSEAERMFNALAAGGTMTLPFAPTFWAKGFGHGARTSSERHGWSAAERRQPDGRRP